MALAGMSSIDGKLAKRDPQGWGRLQKVTLILPFDAWLGAAGWWCGKIGWVAPTAGLALWVLLLLFHPWLFGRHPLPGVDSG